MSHFFQKAKSQVQKILDGHQPQHRPHPTPQTGQQAPTTLDILRYRYHHGCNVGSIFVLERWLSPDMFPEGAPGESELASVSAWVSRIGVHETRKKFEEHWASVLSDADCEWLAKEAKCTTVRLPVGYFNLDPLFLDHTPFAPFCAVYCNAWSHIESLILRLRAYNIGTIIDLHALPGGANKEGHSGTDHRSADLWTSSRNRDLGLRCCQFLATQARNGLEIAGIQVVNEADWDSPHMYSWYDDCIAAISAIDCSIPVIISDAWNLSKAVDYALRKNNIASRLCPVVIDTHFYWAFTDADRAKSASQISLEVQAKLGELNGKRGDVAGKGAVQVIVGEYSCALNPGSYDQDTSSGLPKSDFVRRFGEVQNRQWGKYSGGAFFWTFLKNRSMHAEWNFAAEMSLGAIRTPYPLQNCTLGQAQPIYEHVAARQQELMEAAVGQHCRYWENAAPHLSGEQWRFAKGYEVGYQDALAFLWGGGIAAGNRIGNRELWVLKRLRESEWRGQYLWIFEHGIRKGIEDVNEILGSYT